MRACCTSTHGFFRNARFASTHFQTANIASVDEFHEVGTLRRPMTSLPFLPRLIAATILAQQNKAPIAEFSYLRFTSVIYEAKGD